MMKCVWAQSKYTVTKSFVNVYKLCLMGGASVLVRLLDKWRVFCSLEFVSALTDDCNYSNSIEQTAKYIEQYITITIFFVIYIFFDCFFFHDKNNSNNLFAAQYSILRQCKKKIETCDYTRAYVCVFRMIIHKHFGTRAYMKTR